MSSAGPLPDGVTAGRYVMCEARSRTRSMKAEGTPERGTPAQAGPYSIGAIRTPNSCPASMSHVQAYCAKLRWTWISNAGAALT